MDNKRRNVIVLIGLVVVLIGLCVALTYHRYVMQERFDYEVKPIGEFTEDDL